MRYKRVMGDIDRINRQLDDVAREGAAQDKEEYRRWRERAVRARDYMRAECDALLAWLGEREPVLFRAVYDMLESLVSDGFETSGQERSIVEDLRAYFKTVDTVG